MIFFITALRALAACLITNAHYTGVYPTDLIANGGLLGDVIFFAVSGYCLYSAKGSFPKWYGKRLWRIYLPVILMTSIYLLIGAYKLSEMSLVEYLVFPTYYHFVASIVLLYIPFYIIMKVSALKKRIPLIMGIVAVAWLVIYFAFYDKSYYHIDTVREPMIRLLFMECMLLGAYFKQKDADFRNKFSFKWVAFTAVSFVAYFASKMLFAKKESLSFWQFVNQIIIFAFLYCIMRLFAGLDSKLEKMPKWIKSIIVFISTITLEIYLVQNVIIVWLRNVSIFPINWFALTGAIAVSAYLLHLACKLIYFGVDKLIEKIASIRKAEKAE